VRSDAKQVSTRGRPGGMLKAGRTVVPWEEVKLARRRLRAMQTSISGLDSPASPIAWPPRQALMAVALILEAWALAVSIWPLTGTVVPWDSKNQFYPTLRYLGTALAHGELPLWNPYHFGGHPSAAAPHDELVLPTSCNPADSIGLSNTILKERVCCGTESDIGGDP